MADCCDEIIDIGCTNFCDSVVTGLTAAKNGTYTISIVPGGAFIEIELLIGEAIDFSARSLNEDKVTLFKIFDPDNIEVLSGTAECFKINVKAGRDLTGVNT